jgi:hypothetical protein
MTKENTNNYNQEVAMAIKGEDNRPALQMHTAASPSPELWQRHSKERS